MRKSTVCAMAMAVGMLLGGCSKVADYSVVNYDLPAAEEAASPATPLTEEDEAWLRDALRQKGFGDVKDIFLAEWHDDRLWAYPSGQETKPS